MHYLVPCTSVPVYQYAGTRDQYQVPTLVLLYVQIAVVIKEFSDTLQQ